jgi:hypothetical protein
MYLLEWGKTKKKRAKSLEFLAPYSITLGVSSTNLNAHKWLDYAISSVV